jgi:glycosyltransferase involved in cell wall biosynthesis
MLSLCLIVKPTKKESELLDRCLSYVSPYVDEICITQAGKKPTKYVSDVIKKYNGKEAFFKWENDFAKARNFNFSQATGDYIIWLDTDDVLKGAGNLKSVVDIMEEKKADIGVMNYLYHFNKNGVCDTKHLKSRIIKNDGCVEWVGKIHEDFKENRTLDTYFIENIEVLHITDDERIEDSTERNYEIAEQTLADNPEDPRSYWLMGNALIMKGEKKKAAEMFLKYIDLSDSDEEKYLANLMIFELLDDPKYALDAWFLRPAYPDAYIKLGEYQYKNKKHIEALNFLELGLQMPVPDKEIIAYNPREYDLLPMLTMARIYFEMGKFEKAVAVVKKLSDLFPKEESVITLKRIIEKEAKEVLEIDKYLEKANSIKDKKELKMFINKLPKKIASHPKMCYFVNENFIKETSSGKDLVYYCGYTSKYWNPEIAMKDGVGGSEEAVINLSKKFSDNGYNVTVYCNCKKEGNYDGVNYKHYWKYNVRDKQDITIIWRHPKPCDYDINSDKIFVDLHDVISDKEFTKKRLAKIDKVFVKTNAHKILFPSIPDEKIAIIPNGVDVEQFNDKVERNSYLILNTSSPDRHLDATLDIFEELIRRQPNKPWKLAWYYGWGVYDQVQSNNKEMMSWKKNQVERFNKLVSEGRAEGGNMINHKEIANKYLEAGIFLYPTQFYEIHCISAAKAQLAGCKCVTSDFAALNETVKYGYKVHTDGEKWEKDCTFGDEQIDDYIDGILSVVDTSREREWSKEMFNWDNISNQWLKKF